MAKKKAVKKAVSTEMQKIPLLENSMDTFSTGYESGAHEAFNFLETTNSLGQVKELQNKK